MKLLLSKTFWQYPAAVVFVAVFVAVRMVMQPLLGESAPLMIFVLPVILAALYGDFFAGVFATLLSAAISDYLFISPHYSLVIVKNEDFFYIVTFVIVGVVLSWLVEQLHLARRLAEAKAEEAEREMMESRIAEEYALESEARFRNVADAAPVLIWVADETRECVWFNKPWLDFTGRTMAQELANTRGLALHPDDVAHCEKVYFTSFEQRKPYSMEYRLRRRDGEYRWILDNAVPRLGVNNDFLGFIGSCIDIHDRREAERERERLLYETKQAHAQAEVAARLKDEFIGTVSHELRTPLNAILGWTQMMTSGVIGGAQTARAIEVIERNARSQAQLIEDLLDITRITSGKISLELRPIDLVNVVSAAIDTVRPMAESKNISIERNFPTAPVIISGDHERLQQVIWNLLSNAVKFTPNNGRIEIRLRQSERDSVEITVTDSGKGIEPEFLPFVFDRFRQQDGATTRKYGGLGLGLAIVRNLVEMHGGTIRADSGGADKGATFTVRLPSQQSVSIRQTTDTNLQTVPAVGFNNVPELSIDLHGLKIVVVDDERDARELLKSLLTVYGADVTACESAAQVLEILPSVQPQVLVSDIAMPEMDGFDLIKKVRELETISGGQIAAIALTAFTRVEDRVNALSHGFQMFVPKPVEPSELVAAVKSLAGLNEHQSQSPPNNNDSNFDKSNDNSTSE